VTFENCKQLLGLEDPANRKEKAVRRTAPMALVLHSLIVVWFHRIGHRYVRFPDRPWCPQKEEPSFADILTTLRRLSWQDKIRLLPIQSRLAKKVLAQIIEFLGLAGYVSASPRKRMLTTTTIGCQAATKTASDGSKYVLKMCET
jgi:hypothetical protein